MRFGTKILLLMLSITLGLSGVIVWVVSGRVADQEMRHAQARIAATVAGYHAQLDVLRRLIEPLVQVLFGDPQNRALLDQLDQGDPAASAEPKAQFEDEIFGRQVSRTTADAAGVSPAFHVLLNARGEMLLISSADKALAPALKGRSITWPVDPVLNGDSITRYLLVGGDHLYLAFGIPLRVSLNDPPSHAYFCGFRVDDAWLRRPLGEQVDGNVWVVAGGRVLARAHPDTQEAERAVATAAASLPNDSQVDLRFSTAAERFQGQAITFAPAPGTTGALIIASSLDRALIPLRQIQRTIALVTLAVILLALVISRWMSRALARPVEALVAGTQRIAAGDFSQPIILLRRDELGDLARSFNAMSLGLAQRDLIKDTLGQFVDPRIADALLNDPASLKGRRIVQSVLFSDLAGFTSISEALPPERLVSLLNRYLGDCADAVKELNGYLDKFSGDGVVAFWGPPVEPNHAARACRAATRLVELASGYDQTCRELGIPPLRVRVGIATGEVLVGIIGSERNKKNYTALGDVVNLASRLEGVNKVYGTQVLIDGCTARACGDAIAVRAIDTVRVAGRREPVELFEVEPAAPGCDGYSRALALYRARRWSEAREAFARIDDDPPSRAMASRCAAILDAAGPVPDGDGVWIIDTK